jgi:hypothetical protein
MITNKYIEPIFILSIMWVSINNDIHISYVRKQEKMQPKFNVIRKF